MKILLVDDDKNFYENWDLFLRRWNREHKEETRIELEWQDSIATIMGNPAVASNFDFVIVDLKFHSDEKAGEVAIREIRKARIRLPIVIMTATVPKVTQSLPLAGLFSKTEALDVVFEKLYNLYKIGFTRLFGKSGYLEEVIDDFFEKTIARGREAWAQYGKLCPEEGEKALLRILAAHFSSLTDSQDSSRLPEEFYNLLPPRDDYTTGQIFRRNSDGKHLLLITPACDLATQVDGSKSASSLSFIEITPLINAWGDIRRKAGENRLECAKKWFTPGKKNIHALPPSYGFEGGLVDFFNVTSCPYPADDKFNKEYTSIELSVSGEFLKDLLSRFSSFYGRQGQPVVDLTQLLARMPPSIG